MADSAKHTESTTTPLTGPNISDVPEPEEFITGGSGVFRRGQDVSDSGQTGSTSIPVLRGIPFASDLGKIR